MAWIGPLLWPDSVSPVNVLDCTLICYPFRERERRLRDSFWWFRTKNPNTVVAQNPGWQRPKEGE